MCVYVCVRIYAYMGQKTTSCVLRRLPPWFLRQAFLSTCNFPVYKSGYRVSLREVSASSSPALQLQAYATTQALFYVAPGSNSGPHAFVASALPNEPSPHP